MDRSDRLPTKSRSKNEKYSFARGITKLLRHAAVQRGLTMRSDGFVRTADVLDLPENRNFTVNDLIEVVENDNKQRFSLLWRNGDDERPVACDEARQLLLTGAGDPKSDQSSQLFIRANQGHSMTVVESTELLTPITNVDDLKDYCTFDPASNKYLIIHGTYKDNWESIKRQGLSRRTRKHVHFACGLPGDKEVISGMRSTVDLFIYLDIQKALVGGLKFFISDNRVILSEGDESGFVETKYFWKVVDRKSRKELSF